MQTTSKRRGALTTIWRPSMYIAVAIAVFATSALAAGTGIVKGYNDTGIEVCNWRYTEDSTLRLPYRNNVYHPPTGKYAVAYSTARTNWDAADTPADFVYDSSQYAHTMGAKEMGAGEPNGILTFRCKNSGKRSSSHAMLNKSALSKKSATFIRSTAVHELGHYIGLRHSTVTPSIMNHTGNFYDYGIQKQDDECGVQDSYTHEDYPLECNY